MIKSKKVVLRELRITDSVLINRWRNKLNNRIITQGYRGPVTLEIDTDWLKKIIENKGNSDIYFGIEKATTKELIGIIQLNGIDYISGVATCGILIGGRK